MSQDSKSLEIQLPSDLPKSAPEVPEEVVSATRTTLAAVPQNVGVLLAALFGTNEVCGHQFTATSPPIWAKLLGQKIVEAIIPGIGQWRTTEGDPERDGYFFGRIVRVLASPNSSAHTEGFLQTISQLNGAFAPLLQQSLAEMAAAPWGVHSKFFAGYGRALSEPDRLSGSNGIGIGSPRFVFYFALLCFWPEVEGMENSRVLYDFFRQKVPQFPVGDLDAFQRLCRNLGLFKNRAGRPRKNRTVKTSTSS